jgi:hypothetical protein
MLGLVPSICIRSILDRQQILGTGPRMTPVKNEFVNKRLAYASLHF